MSADGRLSRRSQCLFRQILIGRIENEGSRDSQFSECIAWSVAPNGDYVADELPTQRLHRVLFAGRALYSAGVLMLRS